MTSPRLVPSLLLAGLSTALLAPRADATWSICAANRVTGEVGIASATCVFGIDLRPLTGVLRPGIGGATAQSFVDPTGRNRVLIWNELANGTDLAQILQLLAASDPGHQTRQYGIVSLQDALTFSGTGAGAYAGGVTGTIGDFVYAIQGNVLTGSPVVTMAEQAFLNTPGNLPERLMAAMEAARDMGGDGRCSCLAGPPTNCGSPPVRFTRSAWVGYVVVARLGDLEGPTCSTAGCARGTYHLAIDVTNRPTQPFQDPVDELRALFDAWRQSLSGVPDHLESLTAFPAASVPADGFTRTPLRVTLRDWTGAVVTQGSWNVRVTHAPGSDGLGTLGTPRSLGNGVFEVEVLSPRVPGRDVFHVNVDDGTSRPILIAPFPELTYDAVPALQATANTLSASTGLLVYRLDGTPARSGRAYALVLGFSGTSPGATFSGIHVPLNPDDLTAVSLEIANTSVFTNSVSLLAGDGRSVAGLFLPPGALNAAIGARLSAAWFTLQPLDFASNAVTVDIVP